MKPNFIQKDMINNMPGLKASLDKNAKKRNLALALRAVRKKAGLSQIEVANRMKVYQSTVSKLESPTGPMPMTETIQRYSSACSAVAVIAFHQLIEDEPENAPSDPEEIAEHADSPSDPREVWDTPSGPQEIAAAPFDTHEPSDASYDPEEIANALI